MGVGMTCIFFPTGANSPVGVASIFSDASAACKQNANVIYFPSGTNVIKLFVAVSYDFSS
jgi:hypothetical protein